jgi:hypothetical protein
MKDEPHRTTVVSGLGLPWIRLGAGPAPSGSFDKAGLYNQGMPARLF